MSLIWQLVEMWQSGALGMTRLDETERLHKRKDSLTALSPMSKKVDPEEETSFSLCNI